MTAPNAASPVITRPRPEDCSHGAFRADVNVARVEDVAKFVAEIRIRCLVCDEPFRFVGVPAGMSYGQPMCSIDGLELLAPIEPEIEKRLHDRATYHVSKPETRQ